MGTEDSLYCDHRTQSLIAIMEFSSQIHTYLFNIHFNVIFPSTPQFYN